ncbi:MAG: ABC transporter permease [Candidatus Nanosyncoccaceae bacterium]|jgi:ABC-2 type transport system permease protein
MQVFKYYLKIAKTYWSTILMYLAIFVTIATMASSYLNTSQVFTLTKIKLAVFNRDNSILSEGLVDYLEKSTDLIELKDDDNARKEALYFSAADSVVIIPADFGRDFMNQAEPLIDIQEGAGASAIQGTLLVENYLRLAEIRRVDGVNEQQIVDGIKEDVKQTVTTEIHSKVNVASASKAAFFFNFAAYVILSLNILIIGTIMLTFSSTYVRRRNQVGALPTNKLMSQLFLGNAVFSLLIWLSVVLLAVILIPDIMSTQYGLFYSLNSMVFSLVVLAISVMLGVLLKNKNALGGINNVISLGMSFLCGVFVPQEFMGETVVSASKILPAYWFVQSNDVIVQLNNFDWNSLKPVIQNWLVLLIFAVSIFIATLIIARVRRTE